MNDFSERSDRRVISAAYKSAVATSSLKVSTHSLFEFLEGMTEDEIQENVKLCCEKFAFVNPKRDNDGEVVLFDIPAHVLTSLAELEGISVRGLKRRFAQAILNEGANESNNFEALVPDVPKVVVEGVLRTMSAEGDFTLFSPLGGGYIIGSPSPSVSRWITDKT